jgi:hypothetical protein
MQNLGKTGRIFGFFSGVLSMNRGIGLRMPEYIRQSGMGLPHSTTSREEWRAIGRDSVVECGSPMPLSSKTVSWFQCGSLSQCVFFERGGCQQKPGDR